MSRERRNDLTTDGAGQESYLPKVEDAINDEAQRLGISFFHASGIYETCGLEFLRNKEPEDFT
jgi:hypothetical protein